MGTRSDYYVGRGENAEWLGSLCWDGFPDSHAKPLAEITDEATYRAKVAEILEAEKDQATLPAMGWPWPWDDSQTTDFAYAFDDGKAWFSSFGCAWRDHAAHLAMDDDAQEADMEAAEDKAATFPNMKDVKNVQMGGPRSGMMVVNFHASGGISIT